MAIRKLDRAQWQEYFDAVSRHLRAATVEVRVEGLDIGDQVAAERLPLVGLSYDPTAGDLRVVTEVIDHTIPGPKSVYVEEGIEGLESMEVLDSDGHKQIITLTSAIPLPPA